MMEAHGTTLKAMSSLWWLRLGSLSPASGQVTLATLSRKGVRARSAPADQAVQPFYPRTRSNGSGIIIEAPKRNAPLPSGHDGIAIGQSEIVGHHPHSTQALPGEKLLGKICANARRAAPQPPGQSSPTPPPSRYHAAKTQFRRRHREPILRRSVGDQRELLFLWSAYRASLQRIGAQHAQGAPPN